MKPIQLTMQAFGSYGSKTIIDFRRPNQNLFLITGDTGAGKTTIFDAIVFALYGEASSGSNKKDGSELQSQFVNYDTLPFVELTFSEEQNGKPALYTVHRIPRHMRPMKRGSGTKEEKELVSLLLPDGREYAQNKKETDTKLEEIIGLTKNQFMQVAMIAQGEFMELLRADSNKKKEIFRRLFGTERFQLITDELARRRKEQLTKMAQIRTACQTEAAHIIVPETYEKAAALTETIHRIADEDKLNVTDMETLLTLLQALCLQQHEQTDQAKKYCDRLARIRDAKRDALQQATVLAGAFAQLEKAEAVLTDCSREEAAILDTGKQIAEINAAYEISAVYDRLQDAARHLTATERESRLQQQSLPDLTAACQRAATQQALAQDEQKAALQDYASVSERVSKALAVFEQLKEAQQNIENRQKQLHQAEQEAEQAKQTLQQLEQQEQDWRSDVAKLADAGRLLALWEEKSKRATALQADIRAAHFLQREVETQQQKAQDAQEAYRQAKEQYIEQNSLFLAQQTAFLDAQAGFLAKEKLRPGKPCPVCGSLEHPQPCSLPPSFDMLTREHLDALATETERLQQAQTVASTAAGAMIELLTEKQVNLAAALSALRGRFTVEMPHVTAEMALPQLEAALAAWQCTLRQEGTLRKQAAETFDRLQAALLGVETKKGQLRAAAEQAASRATEEKMALAAAQQTQKGLEAQKEYADQMQAKSALEQVRTVRTQAETRYAQACNKARAASAAKEQAEALLAQDLERLPQLSADCQACRKSYQGLLQTHAITEATWQAVAANHAKEEALTLQKRVDAFLLRRASAQGMRESASSTIAGQEKPDLLQLTAAAEQAEAALVKQRAAWERQKEADRTNAAALAALAPKMEERSRTVQLYTQLDSLFGRLSGKVTGARMDLETFVQRYYLQRILYAANLRFQEMSGGQYELRMVHEEQAGEGRNRGLDLMVYAAVTDKEREIRTLSGGESFMAALALALGMADQIQQSAASIHLDMMFIDEGFGSLDEHSRDQAIRVLQRMAGGSKLIGIISHVSELKQQIEDQLLVTKTENGSCVHWQIS